VNTTVSNELCAVLLRYANSCGIETDDLIEKANLDTALFDETFERTDIEKFKFLWNNIIKRSDDPNFGLRFGSGYSLRKGGVLATIMLNCKDLEEALNKFINYHILNGEITQFDLVTNDEQVVLFIKPYTYDIVFSRHSNESVLAAIAKTFIGLSGGKLIIDEIHFAHEQAKDLALHNEVFKSSLFFGDQSNKIVFKKQFLSLPISYSNKQLLDSLLQFADKQVRDIKAKNQWSVKVERLLSEILLNGDKPTIDLISGKLMMSSRSLQQKLQKESTTYQLLLDKVRKDLSLQLIEKPDVSINDLAFLMAFSDQSAFTHSFKKWTGKSPLEFRKQVNL
jgi:AraC-like DNA-binding protein